MTNALVISGGIGALVSVLLDIAKERSSPIVNLVLKGLVAFASVRLSLKYFNEGAKDPNLKYAYSAIVLLAVATGLLKKE